MCKAQGQDLCSKEVMRLEEYVEKTCELLLYSYEYDMTTVSIECIKLYAIVLCNVYKGRIYF